MPDSEFKKELLDAIESAVDGVGIRPSWILSFIEPVIERNCHPVQKSAQLSSPYFCEDCGNHISKEHHFRCKHFTRN